MFTARVDAADPTHKLVSRRLPSIEDWDEAGGVTVENRAMAILMDYGTTVHVQLDPKHSQFETVQNELTRVPKSERIFSGDDREYRASISEDRPLIESLLELPVGDTDAWTDRTFGVVEFAVLTEQSWVYRSVPHETHIREINATDSDGLIEELNETLEQTRGSAVVPSDGLVSWATDEGRYELNWDALRRWVGEENHVRYSLERLQRVTVRFPENNLYLDWKPSSEESLLRRTMWWILDSEAATPPDQIGIPDEEQREKVLAAFHRLRENLDYPYEIERPFSSSQP